MSAKDAQMMANSKNLDLVKISPNANPPVCKIMDYGKYKYEQARKEKESKKKQKVVTVKEVRLRPGIEANDLNTKANQAMKFLKKETKLKLNLDLEVEN
jgi:translation initiation factor IF-3